MDFLIGMIGSIIMHISTTAVLIIFGIAIIALFIIIVRGGDISIIGNDQHGNFKVEILLIHLVVVIIGITTGEAIANVLTAIHFLPAGAEVNTSAFFLLKIKGRLSKNEKIPMIFCIYVFYLCFQI